MTSLSQKVVLIDGNSLAYRAFFALPTSLVNSKGQLVNAVYGFTSMLIKLLKEEKPDEVVAAFDRPAPTFRHQDFEDYKANRLEMPDELKDQFSLIKAVLKAFHIPILEKDGYEADDIIATLARQYSQNGYEVYIVTSDRDALQLVDERIKVISTKKGISEVKVYDREQVEKRFGVPPEKIPDILGLMGEKSDNIPGIPGVGEKTALKLIQCYGSLEEVLEHADEVGKPKLQEALKTYRDQAVLSKSLATLEENVPLQIDLKELTFKPDYQAVENIFQALEFHTLLKRLKPQAATQELREAVKPSLVRVETEEALNTWLAEQEQAGLVSFWFDFSEDRFSSSLEFLYISGVKNKVACISLQGLQRTIFLKQISQWLRKPSLIRAVFGLKDLYHPFFNEGLGEPQAVFDVQLAAYLLNSSETPPRIERLAQHYLNRSLSKLKGDEAQAQKCLLLRQLAEKLKEEVDQANLNFLLDEVETPLALVLARMERQGMLLDTKLLENLSQELEQWLQSIEEEAHRLVGEDFNLNSPQQVGEVLFEKLKLAKKKRTKTGYSTDVSVLTKLLTAHPVVEKILSYRELSKLKSTYVDVLPDLINPRTHRVHTTFNQLGTATGRLSSNNPNLQNIPVRGDYGQRIREAFIAPAGWALLSADYSQIDLRVLAHLTKDKNLLAAFRADQDVHTATACEVFNVKPGEVTPGLRRLSKAVNFGIVYGMSPQGLAEQLQIKRDEAQAYIEKYLARYPQVKKYIDKTIAGAYQRGFVSTMYGRRRYIPELKSDNIRIKNLGERLAVNTPIQGSSADIIKIAMVRIENRLRKESLKAKMLLQVHDELLFEVPEEERERVAEVVKEEMEGACPLESGLAVELAWGKNWKEAK